MSLLYFFLPSLCPRKVNMDDLAITSRTGDSWRVLMQRWRDQKEQTAHGRPIDSFISTLLYLSHTHRKKRSFFPVRRLSLISFFIITYFPPIVPTGILIKKAPLHFQTLPAAILRLQAEEERNLPLRRLSMITTTVTDDDERRCE